MTHTPSGLSKPAGQGLGREYWVQVCATLREYRFPGQGYERDLRGLFADGSAIGALE